MFSEILYRDSLLNTGEFLELYNPGNQVVAMDGYVLTGAVDFTFPAGASIAPGEYIVIAKDAASFPGGASYQIFEWSTGKLADEGEKILLFDANGLLADFVRYNNHAPWPEANTMVGKSLELVSGDLDNHFASSWQPSGPFGGTPGALSNSVGTQTPIVGMTEMALFPNPAGNVLNIALKNVAAGEILIQLTDLKGQLVYSEKANNPGGTLVKELPVSGLATGEYVLRLLDATGNLLGTEKLVVAH
jgi:hypothetical protein